MPENAIVKLIAERGTVTIAEYMGLALMHPEFGYYIRKDPLGADGDFTTAPEISQIFGELIGSWLAEQWRLMGKPKCALVELGPGRGTLMADILRATRHVVGFHDAISIHLVETSPALRQKQWQALISKHPRIEWHSDFSEIPAKPLLLVANEFFDALPVRQFVYEDGWKERMVGIVDDKLQFVIPALCEDFKQHGVRPKIPVFTGMTVEHSEAAISIASAVAAHIKTHGGTALIVDYGYEGGSQGDTLQAVKAHQYHDPLVEPGSADLTAHVDFDALKKTAEAAGAVVYGPVPQGVFLRALGAAARVARLCSGAGKDKQTEIITAAERLILPEQMGELFKALAIVNAGQPKPEGF